MSAGDPDDRLHRSGAGVPLRETTEELLLAMADPTDSCSIKVVLCPDILSHAAA